MTSHNMTILLAEDDDGHALLVQRNLKRSGIGTEIVHVRDGQDALEFLRCEGRFAGRIPDGPLLLVLDIKMPRVDGLEVLRRLKADQRTAKVPVIVLTTTDDPLEIRRCYEQGCSVYVTKPVAATEFIETIKRLGLFLTIVQAPCEDDRL